MPVQTFKSDIVPRSLTAPILLDSIVGRPRYWSTVWQTLCGSDLADSTLKKKLSAIERLYQHVNRQAGDDVLDALISDLNFSEIEKYLSGYFSFLANLSAQSGRDTSKSWTDSFGFLSDILVRLSSSDFGIDNVHHIQGSLNRLERLYANLKPSKNRRPLAFRALPSIVVEELYDIANPQSDRNPFRSDKARWRNFIILILLLHQGLRSGELLLLLADAIKEGIDPVSNETRFWINISKKPDFVHDPRSDAPSIKTRHSTRQIPVATDLAVLVQSYSDNWRGKQNHPFLFANSRGSPLSRRYVGKIFDSISERLSRKSQKVLSDNLREPKIRPHDLRHTCAVVRLTQFVDEGIPIEIAVEHLKTFFGWSFVSQMPSHYARAYFENRLSTVWMANFDAHVESLRRLESD